MIHKGTKLSVKQAMITTSAKNSICEALLKMFGDTIEMLVRSSTIPTQFIERHLSGDWGNLCDEDKKANDDAIKSGSRLLSKFSFEDHNFYVITEADFKNKEVRPLTTILHVNEY